MENKHIPLANVLIDDGHGLMGLISRILELEGFHMFKSYTAKESLKTLMLEHVHVVISDVKLPDISSVELVKLIKKKKPYVEVINLTAHGIILS